MCGKGRALKCLATILLAAVTTVAPSSLAVDERTMPTSVEDLKVAFLLRFAQFVRWPGTPVTNDEAFVVGVLELEPLGAPLKQLAGKTVRDRPIRVRHCRSTNDLGGCHILLVNAEDPEKRKVILSAVSGKPVLTVGEAPEFLAEGGIIRFFLRNDRLRIQVSRPAAAKAGLELSARLLEVAEKVSDEH